MQTRHWVLGLCLSLSPGTFASELASYGPLEVRNLRALQVPFLRFTMHGASLPRGDQSWSLRWDEANDFRVIKNALGQEVLREDQETSRYTFTHRRGLSHGMEVSVEIPVEYRAGGIMDKMINWWHLHMLGTHHPGRDGTPNGESIIRYPGGDFEGDVFGLGDISVTLSKMVGHRLRLNGAVKLPTGNPGQLMGSGGLDLGIAMDYTFAINGHWTAFLQGGLISQGRGPLENVRALAHEENIALVWHPNHRDAWVVQWNSDTAAIQTGLPTSDATHRMISFGYQRALSNRKRLDLYFCENNDFARLVTNVAPDISVGAMLNVRF